jgi:hypothetical protein
MRLPAGGALRVSFGGASLALLVAIGIAIRLVAASIGPGLPSDALTFSRWAEDVARWGIGGYYAHGGDANYPAALYLLWPLGLAFDDGALRLAFRCLSIPFDVGIGVLLYRLGRQAGGSNAGLWAAGLYLLNPGIVLSGSFWGQLDSLGALPMLASVQATASGRTALAAALAVLAALVKTQFGIAGLILGAVLVLSARDIGSGRGIGLALGSAAATWAIVMFPLGLGVRHYVLILEEFFNAHRVGSSFAFNQWALLGGFQQDEGPWFYIGAAALVLAVGGALLLLRRRHDLVALLGVGFLIGLALYFLPTRVHERYLFGAIVFLAPLAGLYRSLRVPYALISLAWALAVIYVLGYAAALGDRLAGIDLPLVAVDIGVAGTMAAAVWCVAWIRPLFRSP